MEISSGRDLAKEQKSAAEVAGEQPDLAQERVSRIIAAAGLAIASGDPVDLAAAGSQLGGIGLSASEASIVQNYINSSIEENQAAPSNAAMPDAPQDLRANAVRDLENAAREYIEAKMGSGGVTPFALDQAMHAADAYALTHTTGQIEQAANEIAADATRASAGQSMDNPITAFGNMMQSYAMVDYGTGMLAPVLLDNLGPSPTETATDSLSSELRSV
ncbi:MAG: hypothetical protein KGJ06_04305 [Pseudomonadota bacterium]|nr:hypothetical protein [Pseudomonadota bacterium]